MTMIIVERLIILTTSSMKANRSSFFEKLLIINDIIGREAHRRALKKLTHTRLAKHYSILLLIISDLREKLCLINLAKFKRLFLFFLSLIFSRTYLGVYKNTF